MMSGTVVDLHATLSVVFRLLGQSDLSIDFVVDTGFSGFLTLPAAAVAALGLTFAEKIYANLADDTEVEMLVYEATIIWNDAEETVRVLATGKRPLLGTALLRGNEFVAQFVDNGLVTVDSL